MVKAKIAVNGYGTIGKRVADAIRAQDDMEVVGVSKTKPNYEAQVAHYLGYDIYCPAENIGAFEKAGMPAAGTIEEMLENSDDQLFHFFACTKADGILFPIRQCHSPRRLSG